MTSVTERGAMRRCCATTPSRVGSCSPPNPHGVYCGVVPAYTATKPQLLARLKRRLPADAARTLVVQTLLGASRMLDEAGESPAELRRRVTSPNGTTQAAIESFQAGGFEVLVDNALRAAQVRGQELSAAND